MPVHLFIHHVHKTISVFIKRVLNYESIYEENYEQENMFSYFT